MKFNDVISRIERARDLPAREESFARFRCALQEADFRFPEKGQGITLVAGTNGKGTVSKTLETMHAATGVGVGLYTSPHLMKTTERIRSFGADLSEEEFLASFEIIQPLADKLSLSHFEILTLMACEVFFGNKVRRPVACAVFEVGVGGRLDPTRAIPHELSVVTNIGLDHVELLGSTLGSVAREKFAILDPGNLCVHAPLASSELDEIARGKCQEVGARQIQAVSFPFHIELKNNEPVWVMQSPWGQVPLGMRGERAVQNISLALAALRESHFDVARHLSALTKMQWPGRMEKVTLSERTVFLSGDHNPQGVESLQEILQHFDYENLNLVVGIGKNKDHDAMLAAFAALPRARITLTKTPFRGGDFTNYGDWINRVYQKYDDPKLALESVLQMSGTRDLILISGSLYLVGYLRKLMSEGEFGGFKCE